MSAPNGEPAESEPDAGFVTQLLREQAPHLAQLPVRPSPSSGSSNWVFRLGADRAVRLPRSDEYAADLRNEIRWLPGLGAILPVAVPSIEVVGRPGPAFPLPWTVVSWLPGEHPTDLDEAQQDRLARSLGSFLRALHALDTQGQPSGAQHWGYRCGEPVTETIDGWAREAATALADLFDPAAVLEAWRRLRVVPPARRPACLVHCDLSSENLLVHDDGTLVGVIDFGGLGVGDRSVDLLYAWSMLGPPARDVLRSAADADEATWARARAWAFVGPGLLTLAHYRETMPARTARLIRMVEAVAAEVGVQLR